VQNRSLRQQSPRTRTQTHLRVMAYKFEQLDVWQRALEYIDQVHEIADQLPKHERYNLRD